MLLVTKAASGKPCEGKAKAVAICFPFFLCGDTAQLKPDLVITVY